MGVVQYIFYSNLQYKHVLKKKYQLAPFTMWHAFYLIGLHQLKFYLKECNVYMVHNDTILSKQQPC